MPDITTNDHFVGAINPSDSQRTAFLLVHNESGVALNALLWSAPKIAFSGGDYELVPIPDGSQAWTGWIYHKDTDSWSAP